MSTNGERVIKAVAEGLRRRALELEQAEDRLARFAFSEAATGEAPDRHPSWRYFVVRALEVAGDRDDITLLERLVHQGDASLAEVSEWLGVDRLATVDRVSRLTHGGCVVRDLEHDRIGATPLARGLVDLVSTLTAEAEARAEAGAGAGTDSAAS